MRSILQKMGPFIIIFFLISSCQKEERPPQLSFSPLGLEVFGIPEKTPLKLFDAQGNILLAYPPFPSKDVLLIFSWEAEKRYFLRIKGKEIPLSAPPSKPLAGIEVFAPIGSPGRSFLLYPEGKDLSPQLVIFSPRKCSEAAFLLTSFVDQLKVSLENNVFDLPGECFRKLLRKTLCLSPGEREDLTLRFLYRGKERRISFIFQRQAFPLKEKIFLRSWRLPTDEFGYTLKVRKEGLLPLPNPLFERLGYLLGVKGVGYSRYAPFAFETLEFENQAPVPVNLLVRADFLDPKTKNRSWDSIHPVSA